MLYIYCVQGDEKAMPKRTRLPIAPSYKNTGKHPQSHMIQKSDPLLSLSKTSMTLPELKILDAYLDRINSHDPEKRTVQLEKGKIEEFLGVSRILRPDLEKRLYNLAQVVKIEDVNKPNGFKLVALFEEISAWQDDDGLWQITLTCTPSAKEYIFNIENLHYLRYALSDVINLTSRYSYFLYLYLIRNRFRGKWKILVNDLKKIIDCTAETYSQFYRFNDLVLKKCQKELLGKTTLKFSYTPIKRGRFVRSILFEIEPIPKLDEPYTDEQTFLEDVFDVSQSEAERRDLYRDALAPYVVTDDQIDELVQLVRKHIDARGHFTGSDLDQQIYNYLLSAKRHAKTNARGEIKNIYRYLLPIIENNDIGW